MKKLLISLLIITCLTNTLILPTVATPDDLSFTYVTVYTHNHVATSYQDARRINEDRSQTTLNAIDALYSEAFNTTPVSPATAKYNCHSYAWYNQSGTNDIWIDNISAFINDATNISLSDLQPGDIVVYCSAVYQDAIDVEHSALVYSITNGNVQLISKWGEAGVYIHPIASNNPYISYAPYLFFFRITCKYDHYYSDVSNSNHRAYCWCGESTYQTHSMTSNGGQLVCSKCGHVTQLWNVEPVTE